MNKKISNYVDVLFSDVPRSKKAAELREELLANMSDRYDDYIKKGMSENEAYSMAVSNVGDVDAMLAQLMPDADFVKEATRYRLRNAKNTAIGVAMYILGVVALIGISSLGEYFMFDDSELFSIVGLLAMLTLVAIATGLIIYTYMSTPSEFRQRNDDDCIDFKPNDCGYGASYVSTPEEITRRRLFKNVMSIFWLLVTIIYLSVSFITMAWHISWIIWIIAALVKQIAKTIYEMR